MNQRRLTSDISTIYLISFLILIIFFPSPVQGLCTGPEACGILGGTLLSILTIPICIIAFLFAIWPKTRKALQFFAILPGLMTLVTIYLFAIQADRFDLIFLPLIHFGIMILMIGIGRFDSPKKSKSLEI